MLAYSVKRNVKTPAYRYQEPSLPLRNLAIAKVEGNELIGDALLIKGKKIAQVAPLAYATAKRMDVKVSLRSSKDGVLIFRIPKDIA